MSTIIGFKKIVIGSTIVASTALAGLGFAAAANAAPSAPSHSTSTVSGVKRSSATTLEEVPGVKIDPSKVKPGTATAIPGAVIPHGAFDGTASSGTTTSAK